MRIDLSHSLECIATCSSGEAALDTIPEMIPDIVLMDIYLPGISGIGCVKKLKPFLTFTQFLMCTVYEDNENVYKKIADRMTISFETVRTHIHNIYEKLHVQSNTEALNKLYDR